MRLAVAWCLTVVLSVLISSCFVIAIAQEQYAIGVTPGDYVKYGNYASNGPRIGPGPAIGWTRIEIVAVFWDNNIPADIIAVLWTGVYQNGTAIEGNGTVSRNIITPDVALFLPANISQGENIAERFHVVRTENRSYLGVSRTVNIAEYLSTFGDSTTNTTLVFDRHSGMILEENTEMKDPAGITTSSNIVTETNIFGLSPTLTTSVEPTSTVSLTQPINTGAPQNLNLAALIIAGLAALAVIVALAVILKKKQK